MDIEKFRAKSLQYLEEFGEKSRLLRLELLSELAAAPLAEHQDIVLMLIKSAMHSRSCYSLDNAIEFLAGCKPSILRDIFVRGLERHESDNNFWDIVAVGMARSATRAEAKLSLLKGLLLSEVAAVRFAAIAGLAKMAHNGSGKASLELERISKDDPDLEVRKEASFNLKDIQEAV